MNSFRERVLLRTLAFAIALGILAWANSPVFIDGTWYAVQFVVLCTVMGVIGNGEWSANPHRDASVADLSAVLLLRCDTERRLSFVNRALETWLRVSQRDILGKTIDEIVGEEGFRLIRGQIDDVLLGRRVEWEGEVPLRQIGPRWVRAVYEPETAPDGSPVGFVATWQDFTVRHDAAPDVHKRQIIEQRLREDEVGFRQLADAMPQIVWVTDADGNSEYRNERWFEYTGLEPNSQVANEDELEKVIHPDDMPLMNAAWAEAARNGHPFQMEFRLRHFAAETYRWFLARSVPIRDDSGNILHWFGTSTDIDDQKQTQARIQASEQIYRAIGESIDYGVWVCDAAGRNTYASPSFLKLVGITQEQCSEFGWGNVLHPEDAERTIAAWKQCVLTGGRWDVEHRFRGIDGEWHYILARGVPVHDAQGNVSCWVGINLDIGKLKAAEKSLRELNATLEQRVAERSAAAEKRAIALESSEQELRRQSLVMQSILNSMGEGVVVADRRGTITLLNRAAETLHHPVPPATPGQNWSEAFHLFSLDGRTPFPYEDLPLSKALRGEASDDVEMLVRSSTNPAEVVLNVTGRPMRSESGAIEGGVVVFRDVTSRNAMLEKLRDSEERFRSAFDFAAIGMSLVALDGRWLRVNRSFCELVGYAEQELLATDFQSITHPDDLQIDLDHKRRLILGQARASQIEKRYVHKDGHVIDVLLSVSLVRNTAGEPLYFVSQIHDLTPQKAAEEEHRQSLLRSRFVEQSIAAREDEQRRIARDLHDGIGQSLTSLRLGLRVVEQATDLATAQSAANQLRKMVMGASDEIRTLTRNLRPCVLDDLGLVPAFRRLADDFIAAHDLQIGIRTESVVGVRFAEVVETALYRIVQEALTNVAKHAAADSVEITLRREAERLILTVTDDGIGFNPVVPINGGQCFGILGMRERTALLNGDFELVPGADHGTILRVSIPIRPLSAIS